MLDRVWIERYAIHLQPRHAPEHDRDEKIGEERKVVREKRVIARQMGEHGLHEPLLSSDPFRGSTAPSR